MRMLLILVMTCLLAAAAMAQPALHISVKALPPRDGAVPVQVKVSGGTPPFKLTVSAAGKEQKRTGAQRTFEVPVKLRTTDEHTVAVTVEDASGGMDFSSVQVGTAPSPRGPLTVTLMPPPPLVEVGQQFRVSWKASGGKPPYRFLWHTPYGESPHQTLGVKARQAGPIDIRLRVTDAASATVEKRLTVKAVAPVTCTISGPRKPIAGKAYTYTAAIAGGLPPYRIAWSEGTRTGTGTRTPWTFARPGPTRLTVRIFDTGLHARTPATHALQVSVQQ